MKAYLCNTTIQLVFDLLRKKQQNLLDKKEIEKLMKHEDYQFEFRRYGERIHVDEFVEYFMNFENLKSEDIQNKDLRNHHSYWLDLYEHLNWYENKANNYFKTFNANIINEAYEISVNGFPKNYKFTDCKILFTCGIGQSFGYANENGIHFDMMQLFRDWENEHFKEIIAHEIHHLIFLDNIQFDESNLENYFLQWFAIEGLAIKFTNNAEGIFSKRYYLDKEIYLGLDKESMRYLHDNFDEYYQEFKKNILDIRNKKYQTIEEINQIIFGYWFNLYTKDQNKTDLPKLKQPKLYFLGNDLWGTFYDVYGMDELYDTLKHPTNFIEKYNQALIQLNKENYCIK